MEGKTNTQRRRQEPGLSSVWKSLTLWLTRTRILDRSTYATVQFSVEPLILVALNFGV